VTALRIVVGGMLSMPPFSPGTAWDRMAYVAGLRELGHQVVFVEEVRRDWCRDSAGRRCDYAASANRAVFQRTMERFGLVSSACQIFDGGRDLTGLSRSGLHAAVSDADLLVNISGHVTMPLVLDRVARRAYLDQDPVYTQLWDAEWGADLGLDDHDVLFTTGANIGTPRNDVPVGDRRWHHTVPPVVVDSWLVADAPLGGPYTTVASIGRYADLPYGGRWFRSKEPQLRRFADLPQAAGATFGLALADLERNEATVARLRAGGWTVTEATSLASLDAYRDFIAASVGEIAIVKDAYVEGHAGWIGDRSCQYLAAGRPVVIQATGLRATVPLGEGLLEFASVQEAADAVALIGGDHRRHARRARELARECFAARVVLAALVETAMCQQTASGGGG
jgi:hypothetical protein